MISSQIYVFVLLFKKGEVRLGSLHSDTFGYYWSSKFKVTEMKYSLVVTFKCFDCVIFIERFEPQNNFTAFSLFSPKK